jgi:7-keto-8-aminopelargonate synthetase-like enzyme
LEDRLAAFFGAGRALAVPTGYMTNAVVADSLAGEVSHVLIDKRAHPSLQDAAGRLCCPVLTFDHRDPGHVARLVQRLPRRARPVLLTDGVFARDGALAPLAEHLDALSPRGLMLVDDAHGAGVLGAHARGTPEHLGVSSPRIIQTVTLSKAFGVYGGAVLATADIVERIVQRSAMFAGSTPLPLCLAAGALTALDLVQTDAARRERLADNTRTMQRLLAAVGVPAPQTPCPILCRIPSTARASRRLEEALWARDILPPRLSYPGVPAQGYYRFAWSSEHTPGQLERLAAALLE